MNVRLNHGESAANAIIGRWVGQAAVTVLSFLVASGCWGPLSIARASLVAYESFAYADGSLAGNNGGIGDWSTTWETQSPPAATVNGERARLQVFNGGPTGAIRRFWTPTLGGDGTTTWLRWTGTYTTTAGTISATGGLSLIDDDSNVLLLVGKFTNTDHWSVGKDTTIAESGVDLTVGVDLWVKIQHLAGNDSIRFWVNPAEWSSESALDNSAFHDLSGLDLSGIKGVSLSANPGTQSVFNPTQTWTFDDIRVGTSFGAMSAVPEPSSGLLVAGAAIALLARRRRN